MHFTLEVCIDCLESAKAAVDGGANRLEVCSALELGGLTPSPTLFNAIREYLHSINVKVDLFPMIRSRPGDFVYDADDRQLMKAEIDLFKFLKCNGFVFGCLTSDSNGVCVDEVACAELLALCDSLPVTFHRAFDLVTDPVSELKKLAKLGFRRVLTSGGAKTALEGLDQLTKLAQQATDSIIIMPGSGISAASVITILDAVNCKEVHASASGAKVSTMAAVSDTIFATGVSQWKVTDRNAVRSIRSLLDDRERKH